jgi:glycosyltransferase involved in cell wall biosynthesis
VTRTAAPLHLIVAGPLDQRTGGYLYDARIVRELREAGREVVVHSLDGRFPDPDVRARTSLDETLSAMDDRGRVVIDGLAMGGLPEVIESHADRLSMVALVHHPLADETGLSAADRDRFEAAERRALAAVAGVVVTSPFTAARLADFGVGQDRIRVVRPGTEPARVSAGPPSGASPRLACVGTLTPRKGQDLLVEALAGLSDLPWHCVLAGSPDRDRDFAARVHDAVRRFELQSRVDFLGELDHAALDEVYEQATVFVLPSHYEGYGMALTEALARGLPIVSTTGGAIPYTVPGDAGILVPPGDVLELRAALRRVLCDPEARAEMRDAARRHAPTLPRWSDQAERFATMLEDLTA